MTKGGGFGWLTKVTPAAFAVAGATIAAGVYLIEPEIVDLGFGLRANRTGVTGVFLVLTGVFLALAAARWKPSTGWRIVDVITILVVGPLALFCLGGIGSAIGIQALFAEPRNDWALLLLVPGLFSLMFSLSMFEGMDEKAAPEEQEEQAEEDQATTAETGKVDFGASAFYYVVYAFFFSIGMAGLAVWITFATWLYYQINYAAFHGGTFELAAAGQSLWTTIVAASPKAVPLLIIGPVVVAGAGMLGLLFQWFTRWGVRDANRDLTEAEAAFIDTAAARVRAYAHERQYDRNAWVVQTFGLIAVLVGIGAGIAVLMAGQTLFAEELGPSFPIEMKSRGLSLMLFFFAGILLSIVPHLIVSRIWPSYSERSGWIALGEKSEYVSLKGRLTTFIRTRRLSASATFHPGAFLNTANLSMEPYFYVPAAVIIAVGLFFLHRDANTVDVVTANEIEFVDYWTLERHRFAYSDVEQVVIRCYLTNKNETMEAYELHLPGGRSLDLYDSDERIEKQIEAFEALDGRLSAAGVPFVPGAHKGWFRGDERGYDERCVDSVAEEFPAPLKDRVRRLFHVEALGASRTIWPWDPELAKAQAAADNYEVEDAVRRFTKAIDVGRLSPHLLAVAYTGRGDARGLYETAYGVRDAEMMLALRDYEKARELEPTVAAYRDEAWAYLVLGAYDEAAATYRKALAIDGPRPHWSLIGLARVARIQGDYDAAMRHLDEVLGVWGEDNASMPIFYHRARVLFLKGDNPGVVDAITKGLAYQDDYSHAYHYRACAHARLGAFAKATLDMEQAIQLARDPQLEAWEKTPNGKSAREDWAADLATIKAMAAGTGEQAGLCRQTWNDGDQLRARSPLLAPRTN